MYFGASPMVLDCISMVLGSSPIVLDGSSMVFECGPGVFEYPLSCTGCVVGKYASGHFSGFEEVYFRLFGRRIWLLLILRRIIMVVAL